MAGESLGQSTPFGRQLKYWRRTRCLSQLELAGRARSTARYISFLENGRSRPSEQMVHRLADALDVPIRERNGLLESAGFNGAYELHQLGDAPIKPYFQALRRMLDVHEPFPATVVNRWWDVVEANQAAMRFMALLEPRKRITNFVEWFFDPESDLGNVFANWEDAAYNFLIRIRREVAAAPNDQRLHELAQRAERRLAQVDPPAYDPTSDFMVCPTVRLDGSKLRLAAMISRFGSAREVTLDELRLESMYPQDDETEAFFRKLAEEPSLRVAK